MNELRKMLAAVDDSDAPMVLATVVDVVGSAYRRPAAKMLILPDGSHIGSISGGCLERDLCRDAMRLTAKGPKLISFDTRRDSTDFNPRYNLGCNGLIYVLVERIRRDKECPLTITREVLRSRRPQTVATAYQSDTGKEIGQRWTSPRELCDHRQLNAVWDEVETSGRPACCELATARGSTRFLVERVTPPNSLLIFGGGDDAQPLSAMAIELGWDVRVIDPRARQLSSQRFPNVQRSCVAWTDAVDSLTLSEHTAAVLMTHDYEADRLLLPTLVEAELPYVGILGPKSRTGRLLRDLHSSGKLPASESLARLRTPIGLDLGAQNAGEIAVSILGEMLALQNNRGGGMLRDREGPIHEPVRHVLMEMASTAATT